MRRIAFRPLVAVAAIIGGSVAFAQIAPGTLWLDGRGRPTAEAFAALSYIRNVADEGLEPGDFQAPELEQQAAMLQSAERDPSSDAALAFDWQLTQNMLRYLRQLHLGRVDPRAVGFDLPRGEDRHAFAAMLESAVREHRLDGAVASLAPPFVQYRGLKDALKTYRGGDPAAWRVRQIELALERLRWLPELEGRLLVVNIPMFHLWGWERERGAGTPAIDMAVVVGRAKATKTPVFAADLTAVVFRPYWYVPASIVRNEIIPALDRDPDYLVRNEMEVVGGSGADLRIRQRPGPANALGLVKFALPNKYDVYMHATPASGLFRASRRDFSHGCVRVEDPERLATWVLGKQADSWDRSRVAAAMNGSTTRTVGLDEPVRVVMFYTTAAFDPADGTVRFADDVYGHDAALDVALRARPGGGE